jgi:hypothetical protein
VLDRSVAGRGCRRAEDDDDVAHDSDAPIKSLGAVPKQKDARSGGGGARASGGAALATAKSQPRDRTSAEGSRPMSRVQVIFD